MDWNTRPILTLLGLVVIPVGLIALIVTGERAIRAIRRRTRDRVRPWLWLVPALVLSSAVLVYPTIMTVYYSFLDAKSEDGVGFDNYTWVFTDDAMHSVLGNNLLWLIVCPVVTLALGVLVAVLTDRVRYEKLATAVIILPVAISFVAAGVIWQLMYSYQPPGTAQTGTLNALWTSVVPGAEPKAWLADESVNNYALIFIAVWMNLGLATIILSAALKGIPAEWYEAARVDGANEWQVFRRITLPALWPTIAMVGTTLLIFTLKVFDVVYVMTNGNFHTDVVANRVYSELFVAQNFGHASAVSVVLFIAAAPVLVLNIRSFRREEATR
ncbi:MAG: sugar ABC transporter permease [Saccharothrix sp.]|nr:sugar ABC transporter permease [Saccharothrix sp.]